MQASPDPAAGKAPIADELREFFERAAHVGSPLTCHSVTLYTLATTVPGELAGSEPVADLFTESTHAKHRSYYAEDEDLFPRLARCGYDLDPAGLTERLFPGGIDGVDLVSALAGTLIYGKGRAIGVLALSWNARSLENREPFVQLRRALDDDRRKLNGWFPANLGPDFHHVLLLAEDQVRWLESLGRSTGLGDDADRAFREVLQRYVSAASKESRTSYLTALFPREPNRYHGSAAAVTPGASLLGGQEPHISMSLVLAAAQALADLTALRTIHAEAHAALGRLPSEEGSGAALSDLERSAQMLRDLELDLGFNVEALLSIRIRVPILPVEQYYACLLESLGVERSVTMTTAMLSRLGKVLEARQAAASARTARLERGFGTALSAAGAVAIPITIGLAFVGANAREVSTHYSVLSTRYLPYYLLLGLLPVVVGVVGALWVWRSGRSGRPGDA